MAENVPTTTTRKHCHRRRHHERNLSFSLTLAAAAAVAWAEPMEQIEMSHCCCRVDRFFSFFVAAAVLFSTVIWHCWCHSVVVLRSFTGPNWRRRPVHWRKRVRLWKFREPKRGQRSIEATRVLALFTAESSAAAAAADASASAFASAVLSGEIYVIFQLQQSVIIVHYSTVAAAAADAIEYIAAASIQVDPAFSVWSSLHFARRLLPLILLAASTSAAFSTLIEITATPQCLSFSFSFCCTLNSLFHSLRATSVDCVCV